MDLGIYSVNDSKTFVIPVYFHMQTYFFNMFVVVLPGVHWIAHMTG